MNRTASAAFVFLTAMLAATPGEAQAPPRDTCTQQDRDTAQPSLDVLNMAHKSPYATVFNTPEYRVTDIVARVTLFLGLSLPGCAVADANEAVRLAPDSGVAYETRSSVYQALGKHDLALADINHALAIAERGGGRVDQLMGRADPYMRLATPLALRAGLYVKRQQWDSAIADYDRIIAMAPNELSSAGFKPSRAKAYLALGRIDQAIADCSDTIAYSERTHYPEIQAYGIRADAEMVKGDIAHAVLDYDEAVRQLDSMSKMYPATVALYNQNAPAYASMMAKSAATAAAFYDSERASLLFRACTAKMKGGWTKAAVLDCQRSLQFRPNDAKTHEAFGLAFEKIGDLKSAADEFNRAIAIDPNFAAAKRDLKRVTAR